MMVNCSRLRSPQTVSTIRLWSWVRSATLLLCAMMSCSVPSHAVLRLGAPFGNHMVLPRDVPVTIWGTGAPGGDTVRVRFAGQTVTGHSDWEGRWQVQLAPHKAGGPYQMNVEVGGAGPLVPSSAANSTDGLEINDVLVGDVILPVQGNEGVTPASAEASVMLPYALVRVYRARTPNAEPHWTFAWQGHVPPDALALYAAGGTRNRVAGVPVGVIESTSPPQCPHTTRCSAH